MKQKKTIYIASNDEEIRKDIWELLTFNDIEVEAFENSKDLLTCFQERPCDVAVLDLNLSIAEDGHIYSVIQSIDTLPAIFLTGSQSDLNHAIACGGEWNSWFLKPFSEISFMMQICRIFNQQEQLEGARIGRSMTIEDVVINNKRKFVTINGIASRLSPTEYHIFEYLIKHYDQPVSRHELYEYVRHCDDGSEIRYAGDSIIRLRRKLTASGLQIETIRGYGFRLKLK